MMKQLGQCHCSSTTLVDLTSNKSSATSRLRPEKVPAPFRRSGGLHLSVIPAGGRTRDGSRKSVGSPWRSWTRWGFCGLFSTCVVSASGRVRPLPALWKSLWSRCRVWGSRHCWWEGWRWPPSWRWCLKKKSCPFLFILFHKLGVQKTTSLPLLTLSLMPYLVSPPPGGTGFSLEIWESSRGHQRTLWRKSDWPQPHLCAACSSRLLH